MARFGSLPWEVSRESATGQKPEGLSEMEEFLYEINVDRRARDGMRDFTYYEDEEDHEVMFWSPDNMKAPSRKKRRKIVGRAKVRSQILGGCNVVITTLSGAGSKAFIDAVCRDPTRNDSEFDAVIIDEACQASEPESLIPFKYNPTTITLVGGESCGVKISFLGVLNPILTNSSCLFHNIRFQHRSPTASSIDTIKILIHKVVRALII